MNEVYFGKCLLLGFWILDILMICNSFYCKCLGDLLIDVLLGWSIVNENIFDYKVVWKVYILFFFIFMGSGVKLVVINMFVIIDYIVFIVVYILRIWFFNVCLVILIIDIW